MVKEVPLTRGYVALVDDEDYPFLMRFKWSVVLGKEGDVAYARHGMCVNKRMYPVLMHRLITACPDGLEVDHRDGNRLNNQRSNLRVCTGSQNRANRKAMNGKYKGVNTFTGKNGTTYRATIRTDDRSFFLGTYDSEEMAARVYDAAAFLLHGEYARLNFADIDPVAKSIAADVLDGGSPPARERYRNQRLTDAQVVEIRRRYAAGEAGGRTLAREYGVCLAAIYHLLSGRTFRELGHIVPPERRRELQSYWLKQAKLEAAA